MNKTDLIKVKVFLIAIPTLLLTLLLIGGGYYIYKNFIAEPYCVVDSRIEKVSSTTIANATTLGWIKVEGTNIDYPVITETEEAYLTGEDYLWLPNTYVKGQNREVIYGHNILNISSKPIVGDKSHTRFEQLMAFVYIDFAKENLYIQYTKDGKDLLYKIYAVGFDYRSNENGESYEDSNEISTYIEKVRENSIYDYNVNVDNTDDLISLITCTRYFGLYGKTQFRVDARLVRESEKNVKYSVVTNENYDIIK